jgi:nucleoside-diphosphate-sugar epimerase
MAVDRSNAVLVTGSRGFIGRAVTFLLQRSGYDVVSLDSTPYDSVHTHDRQSCREMLCDISHAEALQQIFESEQIRDVIHLAAILPTAAARDPVRATQVNVIGSLNLLELARRFGVRRVVFGSSLSVYGTWPADRIVSEQDRAAPEDIYGAAKLYVEQMGKAFSDRDGPEFVSLRIGRVVGAGARSASSAWRSRIFEQLDATSPVEIALPYAASERILVVHVDDVARMLGTLVQAAQPKHAVYNALCESIVVADLKQELERLNPNITVSPGAEAVVGHPRLLDCSRFAREFEFHALPVLEHLGRSADK